MIYVVILKRVIAHAGLTAAMGGSPVRDRYGGIFAGIFATYVMGDLIAIPFPIVFERETI